MSSRVASGATPSTSAHSGFDAAGGSGAGAPPVENFSVVGLIRNQMTMKPIAPASTITRTSPLSMLVEPHLRDGKLVELEIGLDARLQGAIIADKLECIGHHAAIEQALVQIGHQHRAHDELECK